MCVCVCLQVHPYGVPLQARVGALAGKRHGAAESTWPEWATCCISAGNERLDNILQEAPGLCVSSFGEERNDAEVGGIYSAAGFLGGRRRLKN